MLRAIDDVDGQGIYIRKLSDALFEADRHNQYVAFYSRADQADRWLARWSSRRGELRRRELLRAATFSGTRSAETRLSALRAAAGPRRVARAG
jgi:hypothetical protein